MKVEVIHPIIDDKEYGRGLYDVPGDMDEETAKRLLKTPHLKDVIREYKPAPPKKGQATEAPKTQKGNDPKAQTDPKAPPAGATTK